LGPNKKVKRKFRRKRKEGWIKRGDREKKDETGLATISVKCRCGHHGSKGSKLGREREGERDGK